MPVAFILDIVIAALLVVTIGYCWKLGSRMKVLRESKQEFNNFILSLNNAIARAEHNINELKELGHEADKTLCEHIEKARFLANDLSFLSDKGENIAENLEQKISASRPVTAPISQTRKPAASSHSSTPPHSASSNTNKSKGISAIAKKDVTHNKSGNSHMSASKKQALDEVLAKIAAKRKEDDKKNTPPDNSNKSTTIKSTEKNQKDPAISPFAAQSLDPKRISSLSKNLGSSYES